jgi:hypothetical protein
MKRRRKDGSPTIDSPISIDNKISIPKLNIPRLNKVTIIKEEISAESFSNDR